ncbi:MULTISPECIES: LytR/AlgR family response regulator transcription factor [Caproicibacterium]|jgi:DNA-binding LytR/AlgR family response regulator|uniref:Stage 0 sporulation protein A homolog n=1 Tax=Caproicibacterium lactatifermentans TaxID=2666138 RepID=A0A859DNP7_9FIRM|nr:LytTR family DNA-binding domain-containing protein [Caproicibacterium lactatifermentans]ARP50926.1 hypothetical protein B6259_08640 [Ruminococcaceae bacterium CPB6]MDD4807605.1 LytTR family DNA-binding domain-containing protein [Oscillospiraceae bacterium]QKN23346.1 response regulator [Caproicibacterium lactatifermentans]
MLWIAVCDNDSWDLNQLVKVTNAYFSKHPEREGVVTAFSDAVELDSQLQSDTLYDIYVVDILMPSISGIRLGRKIRSVQKNAPIIYTTSSEEFALDAYQNQALRYLLKPVSPEELFSALDMACMLLEKEKAHFILINGRDGKESVDKESIIVVENVARSALYTLSNGQTISSVCNRGSFDRAVAPLSSDPAFLKPHKSFWVNMRFIRTVQRDSLVLDNNREIPISRNRFADVNRRYLRFLAHDGEEF